MLIYYLRHSKLLHDIFLFFFFKSCFKLQELKANPHRNAKGTVIEARLDKAKGPVATLIVQNGTLKRGNLVVCGEAFGKVCLMPRVKFFNSQRI